MSKLIDDAIIETMLRDANLVMQAYDKPYSSVADDLAHHVVALATERETLIAALHAAKAHPDYSYTVTPTSPFINAVMKGWEPNPEYKTIGRDLCWRRRKETP